MVDPRINARPLPLFAWIERQRMLRARRQRLRRRAALVAAGIACVGVTILVPPLPRLVWNASASAPIGLYAVWPGAPLARGDMVIAWAPPQARDLAATRHYLPRNVPLVKRIAGMSGDRICALDRAVTVNGRPVAIRRARDAAGRPLPWWRGCVQLEKGALFLLMTDTPDSFDGRYFGITQPHDVIGRARPLWTR